MSRRPIKPGEALRTEYAPNTVVVRDLGRYPDFDVATYPGTHDVSFVAPNGRLYQVRLEGNKLRVSAREGGIYVRPKADNMVEVINVTPFERELDEGMDGRLPEPG
jgi:hypothetical protein